MQFLADWLKGRERAVGLCSGWQSGRPNRSRGRDEGSASTRRTCSGSSCTGSRWRSPAWRRRRARSAVAARSGQVDGV